MMLLQLFWSFFQIGLFSIGGGYAAIPLIQNQVVSLQQWMTMNEFTDIITISQMTPGPIAINSATFVGMHIAGVPGALIATAGCIFPSIVLMLLMGHFYFKYKNLSFIQGILQGLRPAVVSLIASAGVAISITAFWNTQKISFSTIDFLSLLIFLICFIVLRKWKASPTTVMIAAGILGGFIYVLM